MQRFPRRISAFTLILSLWGMALIQNSARAENSTHAGEYTIHHNAIPTVMLSPEIATHYGIQRSGYQAMLNVALIHEKAGTIGTPTPAKVEVDASNLLSMPKSIKLREIREGDAIYYIGEFPIIDGEIVRFEIKVTPEGSDQVLTAKFHEQFFVED